MRQDPAGKAKSKEVAGLPLRRAWSLDQKEQPGDQHQIDRHQPPGMQAGHLGQGAEQRRRHGLQQPRQQGEGPKWAGPEPGIEIRQKVLEHAVLTIKIIRRILICRPSDTAGKQRRSSRPAVHPCRLPRRRCLRRVPVRA